eukprot:jgi/Botrbrau1/20273/Bobra.31_1s0056.1
MQPGPRKKPRIGELLTTNIFRRETGCCRPGEFVHRVTGPCFSDFQLKASYDARGANDGAISQLLCSPVPPKVVEIVAGEDCVFCLTFSGLCSAFCQNTGERLRCMNRNAGELIRGIFYNKINRSLITVSAFETDNFNTLTCRSTPVAAIKTGRLEEGQDLISSPQALEWLSFVEFDDINNKVLVYSVAQKQYLVYEMQEYKLLYTLSTQGVKEVKLSLGILTLVCEPSNGTLTLRLFCVEKGIEIGVLQESLVPNKKLEFAELFNEKLLIKQEEEAFRIRDLRTNAVITVEESVFATPTAFIFLFETQLFLTLHKHMLSVWDVQGKNVAQFEDHSLCQADCNTNHIYITGDERLIVSYCMSPTLEASAGPVVPTINISEIRTGRCLAKIESCGSPGQVDHMALADVTAVLYDERRHEIYTGDSNGRLHLWSS